MSYISSLTLVGCPYLFLTIFDYRNKLVSEYPLLPTVNFLKFQTLFSLCSQINIGFQGWNSQNACQNSKQGRLSALFLWAFLAGK